MNTIKPNAARFGAAWNHPETVNVTELVSNAFFQFDGSITKDVCLFKLFKVDSHQHKSSCLFVRFGERTVRCAQANGHLVHSIRAPERVWVPKQIVRGALESVARQLAEHQQKTGNRFAVYSAVFPSKLCCDANPMLMRNKAVDCDVILFTSQTTPVVDPGVFVFQIKAHEVIGAIPGLAQRLDGSNLCHAANRVFKLLGPILMPMYDHTLYVDGTCTVEARPTGFMRLIGDHDDMVVFSHPQRNCAFEELDAIREQGRCASTTFDFDRAQRRLKELGVRKRSGMISGYFLLRKSIHRAVGLENFMKVWFAAYCEFMRDQPAFSVAMAHLAKTINLTVRKIHSLDDGETSKDDWPTGCDVWFGPTCRNAQRFVSRWFDHNARKTGAVAIESVHIGGLDDNILWSLNSAVVQQHMYAERFSIQPDANLAALVGERVCERGLTVVFRTQRMSEPRCLHFDVGLDGKLITPLDIYPNNEQSIRDATPVIYLVVSRDDSFASSKVLLSLMQRVRVRMGTVVRRVCLPSVMSTIRCGGIVVFSKVVPHARELETLRRRGCRLVFTPIDAFALMPGVLKNLNGNCFDAIVATHQTAAGHPDVQRCGKRIVVIPHHWDPEITTRTSILDESRLRMAFLGDTRFAAWCRDSHTKWLVDNHGCKLLETNDQDDSFARAVQTHNDMGINCHVSIRSPNGAEARFKPATKVSTAAAFGCPIVVSTDDAAVELLGDDYPLWVNGSTVTDLEHTIAKLNVGDELWRKAQDCLAKVKDTTSIDAVSMRWTLEVFTPLIID